MKNDESNNNRKTLNYILLFFLLVTVVANIVLYINKEESDVKTQQLISELDSIINIRVNLEKEIQSIRIELDKYQGFSKELDSLLLEANNQINIKLDKISDLTRSIGNSKQLSKQLTQEILNLKKIIEDYLEEIDSLLVENEVIKSENIGLNITLKTLQDEIKSLKGKLAIGEKLFAENIIVTSFKKNLFGNDAKTAMARKAYKIEVCFDVLENKLVQDKDQVVYLRIITPEGVVLFDKEAGSGTIFNQELKTDMNYTTDGKFKYNNAKINKCIVWDAPRKYKSGTYIVELYSNDNKMAVASFILR